MPGLLPQLHLNENTSLSGGITYEWGKKPLNSFQLSVTDTVHT